MLLNASKPAIIAMHVGYCKRLTTLFLQIVIYFVVPNVLRWFPKELFSWRRQKCLGLTLRLRIFNHNYSLRHFNWSLLAQRSSHPFLSFKSLFNHSLWIFYHIRLWYFRILELNKLRIELLNVWERALHKLVTLVLRWDRLRIFILRKDLIHRDSWPSTPRKHGQVCPGLLIEVFNADDHLFKL